MNMRRGSEAGHIIDLEGIAGLIDTVAGTDPGRLSTLLRALQTSDESLEARIVVELALRCRDPLAPLATLCRDALDTATDLDRFLREDNWHSARQVCPDARAIALLNLCDEALANASPYKEMRRRRCRAIRPRLEAAALEERSVKAGEIEQLAARHLARCPDYWQVLRAFLATDIQLGSVRKMIPAISL